MLVDIAQLNVSESWKKTFLLIEKAGGPDLPRRKELTFGERFSLHFKVLAFFFGPLYYLAKGLWKQALLYLLLTIGIIVFLDSIGLDNASKRVSYFFAMIYSLRAQLSYYKKVVLGITPWF